MKQLLAVSFIVLFYGVIAQTRPPLDTAVPIVRVSPSLRNNGSSASDSFGFAIVFYQLDPVVSTNISQWRIVVGAPNGTYPGGLNLNNANCAPPSSTPFANSGLVYLCSIQPGQDTCGGAVGDGSASNGRLFDCYTQSAIPQSSLTPFQQMGASLYSYGGYLVACAPAWSSGSVTSPSHKGACYVSFNNSLRFFSQMLPCEGSQHPSSYFFDHNYCYSGLSLAVKGKTAIFGDPLAFTTGMASYIQLDTTPALFSTIVSKGSDVTAGGIVYGSTSMNINGSIVYRTNTLKGYSVGIGHITRQNVYDYLVAIPRWNVSSYVGSVEVFAFPNSGAPLSGQNPPLGSSANTFFSNSIGVYDSLMNVTAYGTQSGEQFGASMDTADLNQDGYDELIVGAPFYTDYTTTPNFMYEAGRVYVFNNTQGGLSSTPIILTSTTPSVGGRFGHVVLSVGDINGDGTEDFAVSAPFEPCTSSDGNVSTGSVYLYTGSRTTLVSPAPVQKISACDVRQASYSYLNGSIIQSFGYSLASKADLDGNTYNDLAVGAFQSRMVFLLRTFSVANVTVTMTNIGGGISLTTPGCNSSYPCGTVMLCATYNCSSKSGSCSSNLNMNFTVREMTGRAFFTIPSGMGTAPPTSTPTYVVIPATMQVINCTNITFYSKLAPADLVSPLQFQATVQDLSRNLVSDSSTSLADFRAIPILMGGTSSVYVSIVRKCANLTMCRSNLVLTGSEVAYSLIINATKLISVNFVVNNTGDEVAGISLTLSGAPSYVQSVQVTKMSGVSVACTSAVNATTIVCPNIVDGYLTQYSSSAITLTLAIDSTSIQYNPSNLAFTVMSQDNEINVLDNTQTVQLKPTVNADVYISPVFFSQVNISYKAPSTTSDPQTPSAIGYAVILEVDIQRSGVTVIPNLGLTISLPVGSSSGNVWYNYYYLYPASATVSPSTVTISCYPGALNPSGLPQGSNKRSATMDRGARQTSAQSVDCSQSPSKCVNLVCNITNIDSTTTTIKAMYNLYVNDRYFSVNSGPVSLTALATASISSPAVFAKVVSRPPLTATININPPIAVPGNQEVPLYVIIPPIIAALLIIVVVAIILYCCGFFKRKKVGEEDEVEGVGETDAKKAQITSTVPEKNDPMDDSVKL